MRLVLQKALEPASHVLECLELGLQLLLLRLRRWLGGRGRARAVALWRRAPRRVRVLVRAEHCRRRLRHGELVGELGHQREVGVARLAQRRSQRLAHALQQVCIAVSESVQCSVCRSSISRVQFQFQ